MYFGAADQADRVSGRKLAAFDHRCTAMIEIPLLILYLGTVTQLHNGSQIWHETRALIPGLLVGVAGRCCSAGLGLLFASFSGRRAYATGAVAIFFFLTLTLVAGADPDRDSKAVAGRGWLRRLA